MWVIDAHPEDINQVDFVGPDGTAEAWRRSATSARRTTRSFNAGLNSGSLYEYEDTANRLHFYIIDKRTDAQGILHYKVGVKSLDGAGPQTRGVALASPQLGNAEGYTTCTFNLNEHGRGGDRRRTCTRRTPSAYLDSDVYRLSATATGTGWAAYLKNALATAKFGESIVGPGLHREGHRLAARSRSTRSPRAIRPRPRRAVCTLVRRRRRRHGAGARSR